MYIIDFYIEYDDIHFGEKIGQGCYGTVHKGVSKGQTVTLKRINVPSDMDVAQLVAHSDEITALRYRNEQTHGITTYHFKPQAQTHFGLVFIQVGKGRKRMHGDSCILCL